MASAPEDGSRTATFIGITVAICGNILISLALNCQKLAHKRLEEESNRNRAANQLPSSRTSSSFTPTPINLSRTPSTLGSTPNLENGPNSNNNSNGWTHATDMELDDRLSNALEANERRPLLAERASEPVPAEGYGTLSIDQDQPGKPKKTIFNLPPLKKLVSFRKPSPIQEELLSPDIEPYPREQHLLDIAGGNDEQFQEDDELDETPRAETDYLKSKLWWLGFALMNVGEFGNFLSYAYAPASVVAPLGTFALIANCIFAPLMLGERFRKRDLLGVFLAIVGAITVVFSSKTSDIRLDKHGLIHALSQPLFIGYSIVTSVGVAFLVVLSQGNKGRDWVFVDVGLCALFGGYTVLATKGFSTLLSLELIGIFKEWIAYPLLIVLVGTGVGQIRYLNRALMKFDSKVVIPTQFVLFNLAAIIGSAILYRDFEHVTFHKFVTFIYGCATTFLGVFILTWTSPGDPSATAGARQAPLVILDEPVLVGPVSRETAETAVAGSSGGAVGVGAVEVSPSTPTTGKRTAAILKTKASTPSLGISPGQYLLLAASPPTEGFAARNSPTRRDLEAGGRDFSSVRSARRGRARKRRGSLLAAEDGRRRTVHVDGSITPNRWDDHGMRAREARSASPGQPGEDPRRGTS